MTKNNESVFDKLKDGFLRGLGWAFGVTVGFVLVSTILVYIFRQIGGLPVIGGWLADIVDSTVVQLEQRTPVFRDIN